MREKTIKWIGERDSAVAHFQDKFHEKNDELSGVRQQLNKLNSEQFPFKNYINELNNKIDELNKKISFLEIENFALKGLI